MKTISAKLLVNVLAIFAAGLLVGVLWQASPSYEKMDRLNREISQNLAAIDSLNGELNSLNSKFNQLIGVQTQLNRKNKNIIEELDNAHLSRKQKLLLLSNYLTFIDTTLHRIQQSSLSER